MSFASQCTPLAGKNTQDTAVLTRRSLELKVLLPFKSQLLFFFSLEPDRDKSPRANVKTQYVFFLSTGRNAVSSGTVSFADRL